MYYVARGSDGRINEAHTTALPGAEEALPDDHPDILQFLHERWRQNELDALDRDLVRVIEDVVELLIAKGTILFTDLPPKVQDKLLRRKEVRELRHYSGNIGSGGDDIVPL